MLYTLLPKNRHTQMTCACVLCCVFVLCMYVHMEACVSPGVALCRQPKTETRRLLRTHAMLVSYMYICGER